MICYDIILGVRTYSLRKISVNESKKELMTTEEFLAIYSVSRATYFREIKKGKLKQTPLGRRKFIARVDAEAWLALLRSV